jgi:hypothetical protein
MIQKYFEGGASQEMGQLRTSDLSSNGNRRACSVMPGEVYFGTTEIGG